MRIWRASGYQATTRTKSNVWWRGRATYVERLELRQLLAEVAQHRIEQLRLELPAHEKTTRHRQAIGYRAVAAATYLVLGKALAVRSLRDDRIELGGGEERQLNGDHGDHRAWARRTRES